ncbi:MAG: hypothetical protein JW889_14730 [Verrucomicrobia bacterium]|nr:hypothetical protein [Verrucomicrobiota bacterium]
MAGPTQVRVTLSPRGRIVLDDNVGSPLMAKDGVTVAKEIELKEPLENMGAQIVKEVASKTSDVAGDGTTTATVPAQAIYREGSKTGAKAITEDLGIKLENVKLDDLGKAKKITIDKDTTTIVEGAGKAKDIEARVKQLRTQVEETTSDYERKRLQELARPSL